MGTYSQATVYDQIGARDEGGAVGGEKQGGFTNIVRHPATPEGMKRGRLLCYRPRIGGMSQVSRLWEQYLRHTSDWRYVAGIAPRGACQYNRDKCNSRGYAGSIIPRLDFA